LSINWGAGRRWQLFRQDLEVVEDTAIGVSPHALRQRPSKPSDVSFRSDGCSSRRLRGVMSSIRIRLPIRSPDFPTKGASHVDNRDSGRPIPHGKIGYGWTRSLVRLWPKFHSDRSAGALRRVFGRRPRDAATPINARSACSRLIASPREIVASTPLEHFDDVFRRSLSISRSIWTAFCSSEL